MKIAVSVQSLVMGHLEGLGWFTYESLSRIVRKHPEHEFVFIFGKGIHQDFIFADNVTAINVGPPFFRPPAWYIKFRFLLPWVLRNQQFDLFVSADGVSSNAINCKKLVVMHDLNFEANPKWLPKCFSMYYRHFFPKWAKGATRIATVSEYSKLDIHQRYGITLDKIDVVYNGSNSLYTPLSLEQQALTRQQYTQGYPYFIAVGSIHPRKNIDRLLLAFDRFKKTDRLNVKLVIVGSRFFWDGPLKQAYEQIESQDDIIFTGHLPVEALHQLMAASIALSYISLFEGFGIPLVEAMNSETAIITSNATCLPEIASQAALYVDPMSITDIAQAMTTLSESPETRQKLIEAGRIRRQNFSWDKTADLLFESMMKAAHS